MLDGGESAHLREPAKAERWRSLWIVHLLDRTPEVAARRAGTTTYAGEAVGGRPEPSADLLRQLDDDPLRAADVAEPIAVFVALHLANELRAAGSQASDDGVDVVDCECDMADARGVRRRVTVAARPEGA